MRVQHPRSGNTSRIGFGICSFTRFPWVPSAVIHVVAIFCAFAFISAVLMGVF